MGACYRRGQLSNATLGMYMSSNSRLGNYVVSFVVSVAHSLWKIFRIFVWYIILIFSMSAAADIILIVIGRDLPPMKVFFFTYESHLCLVISIFWTILKVRKYVRSRDEREQI